MAYGTRRITNTPIAGKLAIGLALIIVIASVTGAFIFEKVSVIRDVSAWRTHTALVLDQLHEGVYGFVDAQDALHSYQLTADPAMGVFRHFDAGYSVARATARERGVIRHGIPYE